MAKPSRERQADHRRKGKQIAVVLRDPEAIAALSVLVKAKGGVTAAVTYALREARPCAS